jgi:dihydrolipoamide dehydrogenase
MMNGNYSTIVIGAGSAGLTVAIGLAQRGKRVALIENNAVGGDCTNVGCIPSKTLIHEVAERNGHGDGAAILATVQRKRNHLRDEETEMVERMEHLDLIRGAARFVGPREVEVALHTGGTQRIGAPNIVIATGSRPRMIEIKGLPRERILTNESLFELERAPRHLAVIGSGPIGLEMAFAFRKLGSRVSVIAKDERVFNAGTPATSEALAASLAERGIDVYLRAKPTGYNHAFERLSLDVDGQPVTLDEVDYVLIAIGRTRNVDRLDLERAGVRYDPQQGIEVDGSYRTSVPGIYAIGDVTPASKWTHSAGAQGRTVVQRILLPWLPVSGSSTLYPNATFSDPEVANVGLLPDEIAKRYHPGLVKTLRVELRDTDKGYTDGLQRGFIEVSALRLSGRVLGATIVGPRASEMISFWTLAISQGISLYKLFRLVYPYPTLSGGNQKIADQFVRETLPNIGAEMRDVARYGLATIWWRLRGAEPAAVDDTAAHPLAAQTTYNG